MQIKKIESKKELNEFILFPWKIYKGDPNWVPPLISDVKYMLTENPFWEHAEKALFMAYDDNNSPVGRIAGIIDYNYINFQEKDEGFFGFFECINDAKTAYCLFNEVRNWLKFKGIKSMIGPANPSTNDECGFLCEGFKSDPRLMMPYNPEYYLELAEKCSLKKAKELYAYDMDVSRGPLKRLERINSAALKKNPGLIVRTLNIKDFENEIKSAISVYNEAWEKNWGFVPWTQKEFITMAKRLKSLLMLETTIIALINNEPVGIAIAVPDYNIIMKKINGRLFPAGIFKFMMNKNKIDATRLMIMGVKKKFRHRAIEGAMYYKALLGATSRGIKKAEFSWVLDDNIMTQRAAEMMGGELYKKYRIYETLI